ncbi:hypothetical protein BDA99DRAFT_531867 [Phascolomyces articulosus]|uniref:PH domain-containing protein n=1 Tax=Phascolomyces articulosus TaxID=60185 RepID=A0AAD5KAM1_9FUNG|nr:hypothetical protein BDA99DRAFT_531867 [Phascolomyces articulosus]
MPHHQQRDVPDRNVLIKGTEEVPATAPIFEGHLYLQHPEKKNRWQWRLFRFDGTSFTCLSTRKIKLPPDTPVDSAITSFGAGPETLLASRSTQQNLNSIHLNTSPSFNTSHTSPLLATPKDKSLRLVSLANSMPDLQNIDKQTTTIGNGQHGTTEEAVVMASYYQLPKWTVDISNISAISVLKQQPKKRSPFSSTSSGSKSKCFCVRTFDGECYIMKAQKHKDLERWLFVLTKMWRYAQTIRNQLQQQLIQQQQRMITPSSSSHLLHQQSTQQQQQPQHLSQHPLAQHPSTSSYRLSSKQIWESPPDNMHRPVVDANNTMMMRNLVPPPPAPLQQQPQQLLPSNNNGNNNNTHHHQRPTHTTSSPYDNRYKPPMLSVEKVQWIDQWRESLAELAAYDTSPPPIEPIPDDDNMSSISGLTSISLREKSAAARKAAAAMPPTPRRKQSKRSIRSVASAIKRGGGLGGDVATTKSNSIAPADASSAAILPQELPLEDRPSTSLKKKRSDEVKNWISNNNVSTNSNNAPAIAPANPSSAPEINFFQDARTVLEGDGEQGVQDRSVRYHSSIRGRNIQVVEEQDQAMLSPTKIISHRASIIADDQIHGLSPLQSLAKAESTEILKQHIDHAKRSSSPALLWNVSNNKQYDLEDEDENMSLADLQRSLRRISMNDQPSNHHPQQQPSPRPSTSRTRSPSASSILDRRVSPLDPHHHQHHNYNHPHQHHSQQQPQYHQKPPSPTYHHPHNNNSYHPSQQSSQQQHINYYPSPPSAFLLHPSTSSTSITNHPPNVATPPPIVAPAVPPVPIVVGGNAPSLIHPHTPLPHQQQSPSSTLPPPPRAYHAQPVMSSSELTTKSMHHYPDVIDSSNRGGERHYHTHHHSMEYVKKRPKSWMIPSSGSATSLVEKQQPKNHLLMMKHANASTTAIEHPTTRRSIDIMMDTQRSGNTSRW